MLITSRTIALGLTALALAVIPAGVALGKHGADDGVTQVGDDNGGLRDDSSAVESRDDDKRVAGSCSGRATSKLKAKPDDGRLEAEFEVDQNRNGVTWKVRMFLNGNRVVRTRATTRAPSGSFSVERRLPNPAGSDRVSARATSPSGQVCKASLTI